MIKESFKISNPLWAPTFFDAEGSSFPLCLIESENFPHIVPTLLKKGYAFLTCRDVLEQRVCTLIREGNNLDERMLGKENEQGSNQTFRWFDPSIPTFSAIIYDGKGNIKPIPYCNQLKEMSVQTSLVFYGALKVPEGTFDKIESRGYSNEEVIEFNKEFTIEHPERASEHPVVLDLVEGRRDLLKFMVNNCLDYWQRKRNKSFSNSFMGLDFRKYYIDKGEGYNYSPNCETVIPVTLGGIMYGGLGFRSKLQIDQLYKVWCKSNCSIKK